MSRFTRGPIYARYYHTARTAHLERLKDKEPAWFFYSVVRADFDLAIASGLPYVRRLRAINVVQKVIASNIRTLEVPEPLAIALWPQLLLIHGSIALTNFMRLTRTRVVSYAIENYPTDKKLTEFTKLPRSISRPIVRAVVSFLLATSSRVVFGTQDALDLYKVIAPRAMSRSGAFSQLIWALPSSNNRILLPPDPKTLVFLGTFENRKGIAHVMAIWPKVLKLLPESKLMLLGKLGNVSDVREFAASFSSVTLLEDPTRVKIFDVLARSKALILFSQPARGWKEQVGLPIVEALSMGCEIISSDQTGIQSWLAGHGHQVVDWSGSADVLAAAVVRALESERSKSDIVGDLPSEDGRALADRALFMEPQVQ